MSRSFWAIDNHDSQPPESTEYTRESRCLFICLSVQPLDAVVA
jgi:hypothetical protein